MNLFYTSQVLTTSFTAQIKSRPRMEGYRQAKQPVGVS